MSSTVVSYSYTMPVAQLWGGFTKQAALFAPPKADLSFYRASPLTEPILCKTSRAVCSWDMGSLCAVQEAVGLVLVSPTAGRGSADLFSLAQIRSAVAPLLPPYKWPAVGSYASG